MKNAYRYSSQKYNDALLALGNLRIGTLHDFRHKEHVKGICDANEGKKSVSHNIVMASDADKNSMDWRAVEKFGFFNIKDSKNIRVIGGTFTRNFDEPNCYIHCTSIEYSRKVMSQFENADSCVEIVDAPGFYGRLTSTLNAMLLNVEFCGVWFVKYMPRDQNWNGIDWGEPPARIKEPEYKSQLELRAIWRPVRNEKISPVIVNDVELLKYCSVRKTPS